jgi:hypothetical protein
MLRTFSIFLLIFSLFELPVYLTAVLAIVLIFFFKNYIEAVIFGLLIDIIYAGNTIYGFHFKFFFFVLILVIYLISPKLKKVLKFY